MRLFTIEAERDVAGFDADQVFGALNAIVLEFFFVVDTFAVDVDFEFATLGLNFDLVAVGEDLEGLKIKVVTFSQSDSYLFIVVDLLHQNSESWLLTAAILG